jgi:hypothetical protein
MKKYSLLKKIGIALLVLLVMIQFIRPQKNSGTRYGAADYTTILSVPADVKQMVEASCMDCHSNHTNHRWYEEIQQLGWWINNHVSEGKEELNFSDFGNYSVKRQAHKMEEAAEQIESGEMPMNSYLWMHGEALLSDEQKSKLQNWFMLQHQALKMSSPEKRDDD